MRELGRGQVWNMASEILRQLNKAFNFWGCGFFAYNCKLPACSGAFLLTVDNFNFFACSWSLFTYNFSFFTYGWSFFAYNGKVHLISTLRDCKQRSLTVSKKALTVSRKASPMFGGTSLGLFFSNFAFCCIVKLPGPFPARNLLHYRRLTAENWS